MPDFVDPYIDPKTGVLRNKLGIDNLADLREAEGNIISLVDATMSEIPHTRDFNELKAIHKRLFEKVYDWAGEPRTVDIRKGSEEYIIDWPKVVGDELDMASMSGRVEHNLVPLEEIFERIVGPVLF